MKIKELEAKIAALEKKIEELQKIRPVEHHHHHYSSYPVYVQPYIPTTPVWPQPYITFTGGNQCGDGMSGIATCANQDLHNSSSVFVNRVENLLSAAQ